jgi:ATP-dependent DNA helicase DinG
MVPNAKWFTLEMDGEYIVVKAHASPIQPGSTLRQHLWSQVRGAVLTSATLTSCGHFDFFLREAGLANDASVTTLEVPSPFDYARQGTLVARETQADPREAARFTEEMVEALLNDLSRIEAGALVCSHPASRCARPWTRFHQHAQPGAGADRPAPPDTAGTPPRGRGDGRALHHLRHAVLWRRTGPARSTLRVPVHHQAAFCSAR